MRHPFWQWTGWLSIGLTGCLHGQDWRAAVTKPATRSVADRRESRPVPKVVGPFRQSSSKFVPTADVAAPPLLTEKATTVQPVPQFPREVALPTVAKSEQPSLQSRVTPVGHSVTVTTLQAVVPAANVDDPQVTTPKAAVPSPIVEAPPSTGPFAEFERAIPGRQIVVSRPAEPRADLVENVIVENVVVQNRTSEKSTALPVITPAGAMFSGKPVATQKKLLERAEPEDLSSDDQPRGLFSKSAGSAKESLDVNELTVVSTKELVTKEVPPKDLVRAEIVPSVRAQDVSVLVEQVFEDLRQRRLSDARQRTAWLKQLVKQRAPATSSRHPREEIPTTAEAGSSVEPRRLEYDPQATAVEKSAPDAFFDDVESTSQK